MKPTYTTCIAVIAILTLAFAGAQTSLPVKRTLTDTSGRKIEVSVIAQSAVSLHVRRESDGKEFDIPLARLSQEDQKFAREMQSMQTPALPNDPGTGKLDRPATPASSSQRTDSPLRLFKDVPPLDDQLARLKELAEQLAGDPKRTRDSEALLDSIAKAKTQAPDALTDLSALVLDLHRRMPNIAKPQQRHDLNKQAFDFLRIVLAEESPKAIEKLLLYYHGNYIPNEYTDECYDIIKRHAEKGNVSAMIAAAQVWLNGHNQSKIAEAELLKRLPEDSDRRISAGIEWLERAAAAKPTPEQRAGISNLLVHLLFSKPEKILSLVTDGANHGDPVAMRLLGDLYYQGKGCERNLTKAQEWYEKATEKGQGGYCMLTSVKAEITYGRTTLQATFKNQNFPLRVFGKSDSKKTVVIFGSSDFDADLFCVKLEAFNPVFAAGWNLVIFNYPSAEPFGNVSWAIHDWMAPPGSAPTTDQRMDFTGFATAVVSSLRSTGHYEQFLLVGNSLGTGAMAWDLAALQQDKAINAIWISPTEMFLPPVAQLKALNKFDIIAMPEDDPFIRNAQVKEWILSRAVAPDAIKLAGGHQILGGNLPVKKFVDFLVKRLP